MNDIVNILKQSDIFFQLSPLHLELIANICQERKFEQGEVIVEEGTNSNELYIIADGEVDIRVNPTLVGNPSRPQSPVTIATLRTGQSFGEIALVDEGMRSASVCAAATQTRLLLISREEILMLCEAYPPLGYRLMYNLAADLAMKIRNADLRIRGTMLFG